METGEVPKDQIDPRLGDIEFVKTVSSYAPHIVTSVVGIPGTIGLTNLVRDVIEEHTEGLGADILKVLFTGGEAVLGIVGLDVGTDLSDYAHPVAKPVLMTESAIATGVGIVSTIDEIAGTKFIPRHPSKILPRDQSDQKSPKAWQPPDQKSPVILGVQKITA